MPASYLFKETLKQYQQIYGRACSFLLQKQICSILYMCLLEASKKNRLIPIQSPEKMPSCWRNFTLKIGLQMTSRALGYVPGADPNRYYAYFSQKRSAYYFFNPIQNKTVWETPDDAPIFFGNTLEPFETNTSGYHKITNPLTAEAIRRARAQSTRRRRETFVLRDSVPKESLPTNFSKTAELSRPTSRVRTSSGVFNSVLAMTSSLDTTDNSQGSV